MLNKTTHTTFIHTALHRNIIILHRKDLEINTIQCWPRIALFIDSD